MQKPQAQTFGRCRRGQAHGRTVKGDLPRIGHLKPCQNADQCAFARPILAHQRVNLAAAQFQTRAVKGTGLAVGFHHAMKGKLGHGCSVSGAARHIAPPSLFYLALTDVTNWVGT